MARSRLCARPDCSTPAEVALRYDYKERAVWLDDLGPAEAGPDAWGMCTAHADGLRVPHGWSTEDRRTGEGDRRRPAPTTALRGAGQEVVEPAPEAVLAPPLAV